MAESPLLVGGFMAIGKVEVSLMKDAAELNHWTLWLQSKAEKQKANFSCCCF